MSGMTGTPNNVQIFFSSVESFYRPHSVSEALEFLRAGGLTARYVAGGTSLISEGDRSIRSLVDLSNTGLSYVHENAENLAMGATTSLSDLEASPLVGGLAGGILAEAARVCGPVQLRSRATLGGRLAGNSHELITPLVALDARAMLVAITGVRSVELSTAAGLVELHEAMAAGQLLVEVSIPVSPGGEETWWNFQTLTRTARDPALIAVAAGLRLDQSGAIAEARLAVCGVRARGAQALLHGKPLDHGLLRRASEAAVEEWNPGPDFRISGGYHREAGRVLIERALTICAAKAGWSL
jgi:CO/xanthine dehydrogenase FAD-binding subunit